MKKSALTAHEVELVRVAMLRYMAARELSAAGVAHNMPEVRYVTLRAFLAGTRPSRRVAVALVARWGPVIGLAYSPPEISATRAMAPSTAS